MVTRCCLVWCSTLARFTSFIAAAHSSINRCGEKAPQSIRGLRGDWRAEESVFHFEDADL